MASAHQGWYGAQPPPPPPQGFAYRAPYYAEYGGAPVERRSSRRGCGYAQSVVRQFSLVVPVILVIVTAYVYGRDAHFRGGRPGAGDPLWVPLYLTIPIVRTVSHRLTSRFSFLRLPFTHTHTHIYACLASEFSAGGV